MEKMEKLITEKIDGMKDEIIRFLQQLIQIPSEVPPGKYKEISKLIASKMNEFNINTKVKRKNVIGEIGNEDRPSLIFNAHMDTAITSDGWTKDPYGGEIVENKIYGRGAADDKACVAAEIFATKALLDLGINLNGKLIITAVINEEIGGLLGAEYLVKDNIITGDACLLGDVWCDYPIAYLGGTMQISFNIQGIRRNAQAYPDLPSPNRNNYSGINAIGKMMKIMNFLMDLQEEFKQMETKYPLTPDSPSKVSSVNFTMINGGNSVNTIPDNCILQCLISVIPEMDLESIKSRILNFVESLEKEDPNLNIKTQIPGFILPRITDTKSTFANVVKKAFRTVFGEERDFKTFIPTSDAQIFQENGIETILIGPIRGENNHHAQDEFVYIDDVMNVTKIFALTALNYLK
ncbi:MAG: M20/M25/M40 family metallo-hydrolase [Promethearchaeota archaeon]|nr:MAG: M20/M25/M40 family metallo-hydrolase [Candidatus Lokiarchaeota archaeon]